MLGKWQFHFTEDLNMKSRRSAKSEAEFMTPRYGLLWWGLYVKV